MNAQQIHENNVSKYKQRKTFLPAHSQFREREGQIFNVLEVLLNPDDEHDAEVLPMYVIQFFDGTEIEAWPEEVWDMGN